MSNKEILEKAIQKAIDGGWDGGDTNILPEYWNHSKVGKVYREATTRGWLQAPQQLIFNHDFAKALWGEELVTWQDDHLWESHTYPAYQAHLMQMVIADDPIKYLGENI